MRSLYVTSTPKSTTPKPPPGDYQFLVTGVDTAPKGYLPGSAIRLKYELVSATGKKYAHTEVVYLSNSSERAILLNKQMDTFEIDQYSDLVGWRGTLSLAKDGTRYGLTTTYNRQFTGRNDSEDSDHVAKH